MSRRDFGNVRKLPSGRWQARYFDASGRRHQRTFPSTGDAGRFLAGVRADLDRGGWIDPRAGQVQLREYSRVCNHSGRRPEWLSAVRDLRNTGTGRESVRSAHHQINLDGPQAGDRRAPVMACNYAGRRVKAPGEVLFTRATASADQPHREAGGR